MNWDDLKVVLAIHRAGSLTRAARLLYMDQSTAGRRLNAIERDLGTILFSRTKTGLVATDAGKIAIELGLEIELRAERIADRLPDPHGGPSGSVRLISNPWILTQIATYGLADLRANYAEIELIMIAGTRQRGIGIGETDLALWFEIAPGDGEFAVPLGDVCYGLYAPAGVDPAGLDWMTIWNVKDRIAPMRWLSKNLPLDHKMALKANDPPALQGAIAAGLGKALIPACLGSKDPRLARVHGDLPDVVRTLHLHAHPDLVQSPRVQAAMTWLRAVVPKVFADPDAGEA